jgi:hypothetical protein
MQANLRLRYLFIALWLLLAGGCGQMPERPSEVPADPDMARAEALMQSGQYLAAADLYRQIAARTTAPEARAIVLLGAGEAAKSGGDWDGVRGVLESLEPLTLKGESDLRRRLLKADVLLQEMRPTDALGVLGSSPDATAGGDLKIRFYRAVADSYRQMGNLIESANALERIDGLQSDPTQRLQTQTEILRSLALLNELVLENLQPSPPGVSGGWMQLALLVKRHGSDPAQLEPLLAAWRERFPQHPALPELLSNYQLQLAQQMQLASRIAVLLPQSGTFAGVAAAIRDGIMIGRYALAEEKRPELRFYDSTEPAGIWPLYNQAVAEGAELVIGPLQKDAVNQLLRAGELPVPVLALNQVELTMAPPGTLFMYSLSPEDEARQAAERIWLDAHRRPAVLVPEGDWGDRIARAFESRWTGLGGTLAGVGRYDANSHDYSDTITSLLHIDRSRARHQELQRWLGQRLEFEPHRRDDVDAVFVAARPVQAQGIRPQLQFHHAADLPVYATSHAWLGELSHSQVQDMSGIMLADIPWLVTDGDAADSRSQTARYLPQTGSAYGRLYAMGIDAMRLVPHLKRLQSSRFESLDGNTGNLYMDEANQIHRQLVWIRLGEPPEILGYAPRLDLQGGDAKTAPPAESAATPPAS